MKLWYGYGSEHSMNLVMIGRFKEAGGAEKVKQLIEQLTETVNADVAAGLINICDPTDRFSDAMREFLWKVKVHSIGPSELEQFVYDVSVKVEGTQLVLRTDESEVSAFLKVLLDNGARVEVYSAHNYPETQEGHDG